MKIGVISDTHGLVRPEVYDVFEGVDLILHAGDIGSRDVIIELEAIAPVKAVAGNNDFDLFGIFDEKLTYEIGNRKIHLQHIVNGMPEDDQCDENNISEIIVFGHSHRPTKKQIKATLYFNPGSAGPKRFNLPVTAGLLTLDDQSVKGEIVRLTS
ncbi:MAG: metallophosphoesterase family protein [Nitrospinae bacterium]|nr:metallophosphoesterase family protein [Nitrospinota bacterium]